MPITLSETPKIKYQESDSNPTGARGAGAEIPIIIGITGNSTPAEGILKFTNYSSAAKTVANGGIGTDTTTNPVLAFLKDFFEENIKLASDDLCVPYVYVIDLGTGKTTGQSPVLDATAWTAAMANAKKKRDVTAEVFVGFTKTDTATNIIPIMESALEKINSDATKGSPRIAYFTVEGTTMAELAAYTDSTQTKYIQKARVALVEPTLFGKTCARIFTTHYSEEPGYAQYRSVSAGTFTERTDTEENTIQSQGIIFNRDEKPGKSIYPKICLAVSTAFAKSADNRPNDCLLHARRNVDQLIRDAFEVIYPQLKRNETEVNLSYLQADLDTLVGNKKELGYMMEGTVLEVSESASNPYDLEINGVAVPVNATELIHFKMYIEAPNTTVGA
ncbi:hypothetical protein [Methanobrevibacter sp.]|uniref:hypothetical protein n=1 Tax=Methanobrevibacter sp. TaxID=66852 RepID=UPI0025FB5C85|nr:hypothetical protein [Methanobrevibacter sp.]MBQ6511764.1 hypothetical protein [Methanobrevibacter sp.]